MSKRLEHDPQLRLQAAEQALSLVIALIGDQIGRATNASAVAGATEVSELLISMAAPKGSPIRNAVLDIAANALGDAHRLDLLGQPRGH